MVFDYENLSIGLENYKKREREQVHQKTSENVLFYNGHLFLVDLKQLYWFYQNILGVLRYSFYRIVPVAKQQQQQTYADKMRLHEC